LGVGRDADISSGCGWRSDLQMRRLEANILKKQSQTADKWWSYSLGVGRGADISSGCGWRSGLQMRRLAANTLYKQSRTADKWWSYSLGVGRGADISSPKKFTTFETFHKASDLCETWSVILREEYRLRVFENRVLTKLFGLKRDKVRGEGRRIHNKELYDRSFSPKIIRVIK